MSTPTVSQEFGQLVGPWTIETAAVSTIQKWLLTYRQEVERQNGLLPNTLPQPSQIYGAADDTAWEGAALGAVIAVCEEPDSEPEYFQSSGWIQDYRLTVGYVHDGVAGGIEDETIARQQASLMAVAIAGLMDQQFASDHPSLVQGVRRLASPSVNLPVPDQRTIYIGQASYRVWVQSSIAIQGPVAPIPDQAVVPTWATVETENVTVSPESLQGA